MTRLFVGQPRLHRVCQKKYKNISSNYIGNLRFMFDTCILELEVWPIGPYSIGNTKCTHADLLKWRPSKCRPSKREIFARSDFSLINFCADFCAEIAKKIQYLKIFVKWCQIYEKSACFCKFCVQTLKLSTDSRSFCADMRPRVHPF